MVDLDRSFTSLKFRDPPYSSTYEAQHEKFKVLFYYSLISKSFLILFYRIWYFFNNRNMYKQNDYSCTHSFFFYNVQNYYAQVSDLCLNIYFIFVSYFGMILMLYGMKHK